MGENEFPPETSANSTTSKQSPECNAQDVYDPTVVTEKSTQTSSESGEKQLETPTQENAKECRAQPSDDPNILPWAQSREARTQKVESQTANPEGKLDEKTVQRARDFADSVVLTGSVSESEQHVREVTGKSKDISTAEITNIANNAPIASDSAFYKKFGDLKPEKRPDGLFEGNSKKGNYLIYVDPELTPEKRAETLQHERLHIALEAADVSCLWQIGPDVVDAQKTVHHHTIREIEGERNPKPPKGETTEGPHAQTTDDPNVAPWEPQTPQIEKQVASPDSKLDETGLEPKKPAMPPMFAGDMGGKTNYEIMTEGRLKSPEQQKKDFLQVFKEDAERGEKNDRPKDGVRFNYNESTIKEGDFKTWWDARTGAERARVLHSDAKITVSGIASRPGSDDYNLDLSQKRAESVANRLKTELGVDPSRIEIVALGENLAKEKGRAETEDYPVDRAALIKIHQTDQDKAVYEKVKSQSSTTLPDGHLSPEDKVKLDIRDYPRDRAFFMGNVMLLPNTDTGELTWMDTRNIIEGWHEDNGYFVYRQGNEIQTSPKFSENRETIDREWRSNQRPPLFDAPFSKQIDEHELKNRQEAAKTMNGWVGEFLEKGETLETALDKAKARGIAKFMDAMAGWTQWRLGKITKLYVRDYLQDKYKDILE